MDYMTLKDAAEQWGVTPRRVNYYCAGGRIHGAVKKHLLHYHHLSVCRHLTNRRCRCWVGIHPA